jgi:hypothetical protein
MADQLVQTSVAAIAVVGQMHGAVLCTETGEPVPPAVLWPDRRAEAELGRWRKLPDQRRAELANPRVPGMTGPMLAWLVRKRADAVASAVGVPARLLPAVVPSYRESAGRGRGGLVVWGGTLPVAVVGVVLWGCGAALGFPLGMSAGADNPSRAPARVLSRRSGTPRSSRDRRCWAAG